MSVALTKITDQIVHSTWFQRSVILTIITAGALAGIETDAAMVASHGTVLRALDYIGNGGRGAP
jgi:hypothetical protein